MPFKIPLFSVMPKETDNGQLMSLLRTIFGRWSKTDLILERELSIGDWNMDSTASTTVIYNLGQEAIDIKRIRGFNVIIFNDSEDKSYEGSLGLDSIYLDATNITIARTAGGIFDNTNFDSTSITTRGYVTIRYSA